MSDTGDADIEAAVDSLESRALYHLADLEEGHAMWIRGIAACMNIDYELARGILRTLRSKRQVEYVAGLWTEEGEPAGGGYAITRAGLDRLDRAALKETTDDR